MRKKSLLILWFIACIVNLRIGHAQPAGFRFLATGDLPYSAEEEAKYRELLGQSAKEGFAFLMHVGDTKSQGAPCTDEETLKIRDLFRQNPTPVVYTMGDNEWTDCHGVGADPLQRLTQLRELIFKDEAVLRLNQLGAERQNQNPAFASYVENYRFSKSNVLFIVVHVVGSGNNRRIDDPPSMQEFAERNQANLAFLEESFAKSLAQDAAGVAIVMHANPGFEGAAGEGFQDFITAVRGFLDRYRKPVICIHGDSHYFRIDKPLRSAETNSRYLHFTRVEVFGSPDVAGLVVKVDPATKEVFSYEPYYLR